MKWEGDLFSRIVAAVPEGIWVVDPHGQTTFCNGRMAQLLGTDVESLRKMSCFDPVFPEDLKEAQRQFELQLAGGGKPFDFRLRRSDGSGIWVSIACRLMHDDSGAVAGLLGLFTDIAERKRVEGILSEREQRFRTMADAVPTMIWVSGPDKRGTFFNQVLLDFTGRTMEQALGGGWAQNVHPDDLKRCVDAYVASFDARRNFGMEYRLRRADGEYRWVLDNGVPFSEPSGEFAGYIGSCIDITDLKRAQETQLAEQKLATVGSMARGIMHDFGNLLSGIIAYSDLVLDALDSRAVPTTEVRTIRDTAIRGSDLARKLMIYAEQEDEALKLIDLSATVEEVLESLKTSLPKNVLVETDLKKHLPGIRVNPAQIWQVVLQLITNASEAIGDRDGLILVATRHGTASESHLPTSERIRERHYLHLDVSDTGRGMTPEVQARAFDMFFTTKGPGIHGLGLAAVRGIVEGLLGTIQLSSESGKGTTFQISLPCEAQAVAATLAPDARVDDTVRSGGTTVLIVEDDRTMRQAIAMMLRKHGFSVLEASDGYIALELLREHKTHFDVLLLDVNLPGAPGREVYEEARRLRPRLPVIIMSAYGKELAAATLQKVEHFLRKPFQIRDLIELIRQLSPSDRTQASSA